MALLKKWAIVTTR